MSYHLFDYLLKNMGCKLYLGRHRYKVPGEGASHKEATMTSNSTGSGNGTRDDTTCSNGNGRDVATGTMMERTLAALFISLLIFVSILALADQGLPGLGGGQPLNLGHKTTIW